MGQPEDTDGKGRESALEPKTGMSNNPLRLDTRLLEILVCPATKGQLDYLEAESLLVSRVAGLAYPIRDGIPIMLIEEAKPCQGI